ncbi:DUF2860 domain-containing protein [uncultured Vibrio sp.]|uniref:DUF2860 domain-containing protein n=1 Tax=uncultured Vibrio sp. TaxID=114054 RepID=UPI00091710CF|nr:DUF2860 domain-containing protein [uncultured Vibrio sp.]OIQ25074.1 MAG: hypothetical protein BM561_07230 [Vibrio sp. MedPE-SWchi]
MKARYTLLIALLSSTSCYAKLGAGNGFSGEISLNSVYVTQESHLSTDADATLTSLDQAATSTDSFIVAPLGNIAYTFGQSNQQVYFGTTRDDIAVGTLALQLGYKYQLPSKTTIDIAFLPTVMAGSVWQNPYNTTTARQETDVDGNAYRLKLSNIAGSLFSLDMAYGDKEVEQDSWENTNLDRDAETYFVKGQVRVPLSRATMLAPAISYTKQEAEGTVNSFERYRGELSVFQFLGAHQIALTASYSQTDYQSANPLFSGQTRSDNGLSLFAAYEYVDFLGYKNWSLISFLGYDSTDANIDFYDESQTIVSLGVNYQF